MPLPKLEVFAVGGWKEGYFADRGPRLTCRLINAPPGISSVPITVRTQTRDNVCSLPLVVKQELQGNSMKNWQHVFTVQAVAAGAETGKLLLVKAKTRKVMEDWLVAFNNPKKETRKHSGELWLKPSEERRFFTLDGDKLFMRKAEPLPVASTWSVPRAAIGSGGECAQHFERTLTLRAENQWQSTVVFQFQLGFFMSEQQYVASAPSQFGIRPVRTQWFIVKSSNRHTGRDSKPNGRRTLRGQARAGRGRGENLASKTSNVQPSAKSQTGPKLGFLGDILRAKGSDSKGALARPSTHEKRSRNSMTDRRKRTPGNDSAQAAAGLRDRARSRGSSTSSSSLNALANEAHGKKIRSSSGQTSGTELLAHGLSSLLADELRDVHLSLGDEGLNNNGLLLRPEDRNSSSARLRALMQALVQSELDEGRKFSRSREISFDANFRDRDLSSNSVFRDREISNETGARSLGSFASLDSWRSFSTDAHNVNDAAAAGVTQSSMAAPPAPVSNALRLTSESLHSLRTYLGDLCQTMESVTEFESGVTSETLSDVHAEALRLVHDIEKLQTRHRSIQPNLPKSLRVKTNTFIRHRVHPEDTLTGICLRYNVEASVLKHINEFTKDNFWTKEYLLIPEPEAKPNSNPVAINAAKNSDRPKRSRGRANATVGSSSTYTRSTASGSIAGLGSVSDEMESVGSSVATAASVGPLGAVQTPD